MVEQRRPKAFISCSLRGEDKTFIDFIIRIVKRFGFDPFGTVGKYSSEAQPVWRTMKGNIEKSDCVVIVATPRYIQQDLNEKKYFGYAVSEMIHTEIGMAVMANRPVLVFVQEGTDVGSFIPSYVQYITLNQNNVKDVKVKWPLIANYFRSAISLIQNAWLNENRAGVTKFISVILGLIGAATLIDSIFGASPEVIE